MNTPSATIVKAGYAPVNGLRLYYESFGEGGTPLVVLHGGFGLTALLGDLPARLAEHRQVIAVDLQGHGHTADIDRAFSWSDLASDVAELIGYLGLGQTDVMGYSLGGGTSLRLAIEHPELVRRLVLVSTAFRRDGSYPEVLIGMGQVNSAGFEQMRHTPLYDAYAAVAPDPEAFPTLMDKTGALLAQPYDWTAEVSRLEMPVLLIYGDADSISPQHIVEFFGLLGGGKADGGWDRSNMVASRLAVLPGTTHYEIFTLPQLPDLVVPFLDDPIP